MTPLHNAHSTLPPAALGNDRPQRFTFDWSVGVCEHVTKQLPTSGRMQAAPRPTSLKGREKIFKQACKTGDEAAVRRLLTAGQSRITLQEYYWFVDHAATYKKNGILDLLLQLKKGNPDEYGLLLDCAIKRATLQGYTDMVRDLLEKGAPVQKDGESALHSAMMHSRREIAALLLEAGANIEASDRAKRFADTPLTRCVVNSDESCLRWLLARGANPNGRADNQGLYPLAVACLYGNLSKVKILLEAGAHIDAGKQERMTPLAVALQQQHTEVARHLIHSGADVNAACEPQHAPLYQAVRSRLHGLSEVLLDAGAAPDLLCKQEVKKTPLMVAIEQYDSELIELLLDRGADMHRKDHKGRSALDLAKGLGSKYILTLLHSKLIQQADQPAAEPQPMEQ